MTQNEKVLAYIITSVTETRTNSYGEKKSYARYFYGRV